MQGARWFIARNKEKVGPFSSSDLKQMAQYGLLQPGEHLWLEGTTQWLEATSLPGLFTAAGEKTYWLMIEGKTRGPFVKDQIVAGLNTHKFTLDHQACADEGRRWLTLRQIPEFQDFKLETIPLTPSRARLLTGTLEFDEASLHLEGKRGDLLAKLISTVLDMKRNYAGSPALAESLDATKIALRKRRTEAGPSMPEAPAAPNKRDGALNRLLP